MSNNQGDIGHGGPSDEDLLEIIQEAAVIGSADDNGLQPMDIANRLNSDVDTVQKRLHDMAEAGLVERRETPEGYVWIAYSNT